MRNPEAAGRQQYIFCNFRVNDTKMAHEMESLSFYKEVPAILGLLWMQLEAVQRMPQELEQECENGNFPLIIRQICLIYA